MCIAVSALGQPITRQLLEEENDTRSLLSRGVLTYRIATGVNTTFCDERWIVTVVVVIISLVSPGRLRRYTSPVCTATGLLATKAELWVWFIT